MTTPNFLVEGNHGHGGKKKSLDYDMISKCHTKTLKKEELMLENTITSILKKAVNFLEKDTPKLVKDLGYLTALKVTARSVVKKLLVLKKENIVQIVDGQPIQKDLKEISSTNLSKIIREERNTISGKVELLNGEKEYGILQLIKSGESLAWRETIILVNGVVNMLETLRYIIIKYLLLICLELIIYSRRSKQTAVLACGI